MGSRRRDAGFNAPGFRARDIGAGHKHDRPIIKRVFTFITHLVISDAVGSIVETHHKIIGLGSVYQKMPHPKHHPVITSPINRYT